MGNLRNSIVFVVIMISAIITKAVKSKAKTTNDILGEISSDGSVSRGAISYALGSNGGYTLKDETGYRQPSLMRALPSHFDPPAPGPMESVNETPSTTDYYDGAKNLNVIRIQCKVYANAAECLKQSSCGWCGSSNTCILGNNLGPLSPCVKSTFAFGSPAFNPTTRVVNDMETGGVQLTASTK